MFCQFFTKRCEIAPTISDRYLWQIQVLVQFIILFDSEKIVAVTWCNRVEKLSEFSDVSSLMRLEISGYENDALVGKPVASLALLPETDVEMDALLVDKHIEDYHVALKCN